MAHVSPTLTVSLDAIAANWRLLRARHAAQDCAAVVKADAYGLGMIPVAQRLAREGCRTFFVATLEEGIALREGFGHCEHQRSNPELDSRFRGNDTEIYVFGGLLKGEEKDYAHYRLSPVLNTLGQVERAQDSGLLPSSALHIDTGMCRLGLNPSDAAQAQGAPIALLMTHLATASTPEHPLNAEQLALFGQARRYFPGVRCSMANSAGLFLDAAFHYDLGRPGCALYGITPNPSLPNPMQQVAELKAPILQQRIAERNQTVGYGATASVAKGTRILTVGMGYADGLHRVAGGFPLAPNEADRSRNGIYAYIGDYALPLLGRVSMDLTCWDASGVPPQVLESADFVSLMNAQQPVDRLAEICHTIGYEIFTRLGCRVQRIYESQP